MTAFISPVLAAGLMDLRPGLTFWTAVTFLLLLFVLGRFAWGPIIRMLDERERTIREAIEQAKKERTEAEHMLAEQTAALSAAQREAAALAQKSRQDVEALRAELTERARKEADELVAASRRQIEEEKSKAIAELKAEVADLAIAAAERLITSSLDEKAQRALVEDYIAKLPAGRAA